MTHAEQQLATEIGLTLRRLRRAHGLTQKALAQQVADGMDATYIGKIERGDQLPSLKVLLRLSSALNVAVSEFFSLPSHALPEPVLHLEPLLYALHNRGIDGIAFVRALLDAIGQHVLVSPSRRDRESESAPRVDSRTAIPLPMPDAARSQR
jgi:transcriptional regulator with XRE-family HTH domain